MKSKRNSGTPQDLTSLLETCKVIEVTAMNWAPFYTKGDMLFMHPDCELKLRDHIALTTRSGRQVLGVYIEKANRQTVIQSFEGHYKFESFDNSDITSVSKIVAAVHK
jgi:N-acetyl-anhydromuramyl-L-alanine amidase AmpD